MILATAKTIIVRQNILVHKLVVHVANNKRFQEIVLNYHEITDYKSTRSLLYLFMWSSKWLSPGWLDDHLAKSLSWP